MSTGGKKKSERNKIAEAEGWNRKGKGKGRAVFTVYFRIAYGLVKRQLSSGSMYSRHAAESVRGVFSARNLVSG